MIFITGEVTEESAMSFKEYLELKMDITAEVVSLDNNNFVVQAADLSLDELHKCINAESFLFQFKWRDRHGIMHLPQAMSSQHLFYTILMIWNHHAPEELKFKPYNAYDFPAFYTHEYMRNAVYYLGRELSFRTDLNSKFQKVFKELGARFNSLCAPEQTLRYIQ